MNQYKSQGFRMPFDLDLKNKALLTLDDLSDSQLRGLVQFAHRLKEEKLEQGACTPSRLAGLNLAMVFQKASTRTRCATSVAARDEGAAVEYLGQNDIHLGKKESVADTARVLGRMFDGIMFRGFAQQTVEQLAEHAGVPVWNGLTNECHPTQALADLQTVVENFPDMERPKIAYLGDGQNNVCRSLMIACAKFGFHMVNCCPESLAPPPEWLDRAQRAAKHHEASISVTHSPEEAVKGANVLYTDVWASMGEEKRFQERREILAPYQVNMSLVEQTGNLQDGNVIFLHCLPAFHNSDTELTKDIGALEVTDEVFEAPFSQVFEQAENRVHTIKATMLATLAQADNVHPAQQQQKEV